MGISTRASLGLLAVTQVRLTSPVRWGLSLGPSTTIPWWGTNLHGSSCPMHLSVHEPGPHAQGTSAEHRTLNIPKVGRGTLEDTGG